MNNEMLSNQTGPPERLPPKQETSSSKKADVTTLPIYDIKNNLAEALQKSDTVIVAAGTGTGKTLGIPLMIREIFGDKKVVVTQPRKKAADDVAAGETGFLGEKRIGQTVGLRHKDQYTVSESTRILFEVEGSLLNDLKENPTLSNHDVVIVDEVHERGVNTDLVLALLKKAQKERAKVGMTPLKIVATSATLDAEKFRDYLKTDSREIPLIDLDIKSHHNVTPVFEENDIEWDQMPLEAAKKVGHIISGGKEMEGDILIFMPGIAEIDKTAAYINVLFDKAKIDKSNFEIRKFTKDTPKSESDQLAENKSGKRRIIIATTVAETSVTMPIKHVIDSGLINQPTVDPVTGTQTLVKKEHSQSGVKQRRGRAGRLYDGTCWHLYKKTNFDERPQYQSPLIQNTDLTGTVLTLKNLGMDFSDLELPDKPDERVVESAIKSLKILGALDLNGKITAIGEEMAKYTVDPHLARLMVEAKKRGCEDIAGVVAAFFAHNDKLFKGDEVMKEKVLSKYRDAQSDFITYLNLWMDKGANHPGDNAWVEKMGLNQKTLLDIDELRYELTKTQPSFKQDKNKTDQLRKCLAIAFSDNLCAFVTEDERFRRYEETPIFRWEKYPRLPNIIIGNDSGLYGASPKYLVAGKISKPEKSKVIYLEFCHRLDHDSELTAQLLQKIDSVVRPKSGKTELEIPVKTTTDKITPATGTKQQPSGEYIPETPPPPERLQMVERQPGLVRRFVSSVGKFWSNWNPVALVKRFFSIFGGRKLHQVKKDEE